MATIKSNRSKTIFDNLRQALRSEVLVGIPGDTAARAAEPGKANPPSNALVGYIMEHGDDEKHIPARPFLVPGVMAIRKEITATLIKGIEGALSGKTAAYTNALNEIGLAAQVSVKATMMAGPYAPLSARTIEARARRRYSDTGKLVGNAPNRNARQFLKLQGEGVPDAVLHDAGLAQPLLDTRSLYGSITYVIRTKNGT